MEGDKCLVCFEPSSGPGHGQQPFNYDDDDTRLLSNNTFAKIFNLSTGQKTKLIRNSSSIYICSKCSGQLEQIHEVYEELKALEEQLSHLKDSMKNTIVSSFAASESNENGNGLVQSIREEIVKGRPHSNSDDDGSDLDEPNFSKYQFKPVIKKDVSDIFAHFDYDLGLEHDDDFDTSFKPPPAPSEIESPKSKKVQIKKTKENSKKITQENNDEAEDQDQSLRKSKRKRKPSRKILDELADVDDLSKNPDYEPELDDIEDSKKHKGENEVTDPDEDLSKFCLQIQPSLILIPIPFRKKNRSISVQDDLIKKFIEEEKKHLKKQRSKIPKKEGTNNSMEFQCPHCFKYLTSRGFLRTHLKKKHGVEIVFDRKKEACTDCDPIKYFSNIKVFEKHRKLRHSYPEPIIVMNSDDNNNKFYICPEPSCCNQFKFDYYYRAHYKMVHDSNQVQLCVDCGKTFRNRRYLKSHIVRRHPKDNEQFICDQCSSVFKSKVALDDHLKKLHGPLKFKCQHRGCHKAFNINSRLQEHEIQEHLKEKRFQCEHCPSKFFLGIRLRQHMKTMHTNFDPQVICQTCGKNFRQSYITIHQKQVHEKEFHHFCHLCNKGYYRLSDLKVHIKNHPGKNHLICSFKGCDSTFSALSGLRAHKMSHSDSYNFECQFCEKKFKRRPNLNEHIELHHKSESSYSCECGQDFKLKRYLLIHMKKCEELNN